MGASVQILILLVCTDQEADPTKSGITRIRWVPRKPRMGVRGCRGGPSVACKHLQLPSGPVHPPRSYVLAG